MSEITCTSAKTSLARKHCAICEKEKEVEREVARGKVARGKVARGKVLSAWWEKEEQVASIRCSLLSHLPAHSLHLTTHNTQAQLSLLSFLL